MDNEIETSEASNPTVIYMEQPTVKQQLVQTAVGLGVTIALGAAMVGIGAAVNGIGNAVQKRKAKKAQKLVETVPTETTDNE